MNGRRIPRAGIVALATLIIAAPAAFSLADVYRTNGSGLVKHHHVHDHPVRVAPMAAEPSLEGRIKDARADWQGDLDKVGVPLEGTPSQSQINFVRDQLCGNNAVAIWNSAYHPDAEDIPTVVTMNACQTVNLSGDEKQGHACRVIGEILGLDKNTEAARNDCMEDPTTYKGVGQTSAGHVDAFFGPNVAAVDDATSGSLYANRGGLDRSLAYAFTASASGHAMQSLEVLLDGQLVAPASQAPCAEQCTVSVPYEVDPGEIASGDHTLKVVATNEFGETDEAEFPVVACDKYVSTGGSDSNAGSSAAPYATVGKLFGSLASGQAGCFRTGTYTFDAESVTDANVTVRPYGSEDVTLMGSLRVQPEATGATIEGLILDGRSNVTNNGPKIYASDVTLRDNEITNNHEGICVQVAQFSPDPRPSDVLIEGNRIHDCGNLVDPFFENHHHGIYIEDGLRTVVRDNWIYDNAHRGVQQYPDADGGLITGNVIEGNGEGVNFGGDNSNTNCSDDNTVTGNVITYSDIRWNAYSGAQGIDCSGNVVEDNCVWAKDGDYDADGGIETPSRSFTAADNDIAQPQYVNRPGKNFHLQSSSPCLDEYTGSMSLP